MKRKRFSRRANALSQPTARFRAIALMIGLTWAFAAAGFDQIAQSAPTVPSLESALAAPPPALAQSYAVAQSTMKMISMIAHGNTTIVTPEGEINVQNAERWKEALERRLSIYERAIEKRGYSDFAGTYHLASISATCLKSGSFFAGMAQSGKTPRFTIRQEKFHLQISFGETPFENAPAIAAESSFVFADPMNGDYLHVGELLRGRIEIRPQSDVLPTWPQWSSPPNKNDIDKCVVVLARGEQRPGEFDAVAQAAAEVLKPYLEAAENDDAAAEAFLGDVYESGAGAPRDLVKAVAWYRKAANQGNPAAQLRLAAMYDEGRGVPLDAAEAFTLYKKAADAGLIDAQGKLGVMYLSGRGVPRDAREGAAWLHKASRALADFFRADSPATESRPNVAPGSSDTIAWLRVAAGQNIAEAQFSLGYIAQQEGILQSGSRTSFEEAARWYGKAAEQGYASAEESLAVLHGLGWGLAKDDFQTVKWLEMAAAHGSASAQNSLGGHFHRGEGVARDYIEAYKWYEIAASRSSTTGIVPIQITQGLATRNRDGIATIMTADQIAEAKRRARAWVGSATEARFKNPRGFTL